MNNTKNKTAVIYTRTASIDENSKSKISAQITACVDYALENEIQIAKIYTDIGLSAKHIGNRPSLQDILAFASIKKNDLSFVLVSSYDRISRNAGEATAFEALLAKKSIEIVSVSQPNNDLASQKFIKTLLFATAELDNDIKRQRVCQSMKAGFEAGNWMWKVPFGYIRKPDKSIARDKDQYLLIKRIFVEAGRGVSTAEIAEEANSSFTDNDVKFSADSVERMIKNPFYKGFMKSSFCSNLVKGNFKPIVTLKQWERANSKV